MVISLAGGELNYESGQSILVLACHGRRKVRSQKGYGGESGARPMGWQIDTIVECRTVCALTSIKRNVCEMDDGSGWS